MLIVLGAVLLGIFGIYGTFLSIEAKQRKADEAARSMQPRGDRTTMGQAISERQ
jgi:hypothetical protein